MARVAKFASEAELAAVVVADLKAEGWEVWQEVKPRFADWRADIVAARGPLLMVVEAKLALSFAVLEQARRWTSYAHLSVAATPASPSLDSAAAKCAEALGIGLLSVRFWPEVYTREGVLTHHVKTLVAPPLHRRVLDKSLRACLCDEQREDTAGQQSADFYTPFKATMKRLAAHVARNHGALLRDAAGEVQSHYSSPGLFASALLHWGKAGALAKYGIELRRDGKRWRLYPREVSR